MNLSDQDRILRERVRDLMLGARYAHTIDEIKARLEKLRGVRFNRHDVVAAIGKLQRSYELTKTDRGFPKEPVYLLRESPAKQASLFGGNDSANT